MSTPSITVTESETLVQVQVNLGATGPQGPEGPTGPAGSDASVTEANIISALGYTPADDADARLTNARTPTAHKSSHATGGSDALAPSDIGAATSAQGAKADTALQPASLLTGGGTITPKSSGNLDLNNLGGTVDNAAVGNAVATDPQNIRSKMQIERVENRVGRLFALHEKLISGGSVGGVPQIRIATMRDSTGQKFARPYWYGKYGCGGIIARPSDYVGSAYDWVTHASGTTIISPDTAPAGSSYSEFISGTYWSVPTNGTVTYLAMPTQTTNAEVYYFAQNGGGSFKLQYAIESSTTYADLYSQSSGTVTSGSAIVTGLAAGIVSDLQVGMTVTGNNIPAGTTIQSINSTTQITLSANATGSGSVTLTFANKIYNTNNGGAQAIVKIRPFIENFGVGQGFCRNYKLRAVGVSGTSKIIGIGTVLASENIGSRPRGVVTMDWGQGGSTMANWVTMNATVFQNGLAAYAPDIIFIRDWEPIGSWASDVTTNFPTLISRIRAALPRVAIVVVGSHPTNENADCENPFYEHPMDVWLKNYCKNNDIEFLDVRKYFPSYSTMVAMGWQSSGDGVHLNQTSAEWFLDALIADRIPMLAGASPWDWKIGGSAIGTPPLQNVTTIQNGNGQLQLSGFTSSTRAYFSLSPADGNSNANFLGLSTGIGRLRSDSTYFWHDGRLGLFSSGQLGAIVGQGRMWIGTGASSTEYGLQKQINGGSVVQAPATSLPAGMFGGISGQTANIFEVKTGMSSTSDGTTASGFNKDGIPFAPSFTTTQRDALTSPPAGGIILNTTTGKLNFYTGSAWEAITSA